MPGSDALASLRAQFPVVNRLAYLNAGTNGPIAEAATAAVRAQAELEERDGRGGMPFFEVFLAQVERLRTGYAAYLNAAPGDVALTTSTTDGVSRVLLALDLRPGDEILTSDEEHPGVYGPLVAQRARGVTIRTAPLAELADAIGPATRLVVCSHVSWRSGAYAPTAALAAAPPLVLLDGAQGIGAVPTDVGALGADFYAGAGQKWLCGPAGTGMLWIDPAVRERLTVPSPAISTSPTRTPASTPSRATTRRRSTRRRSPASRRPTPSRCWSCSRRPAGRRSTATPMTSQSWRPRSCASAAASCCRATARRSWRGASRMRRSAPSSSPKPA